MSNSVGYKRPPADKQFRPGQSGNPGERPKRRRSFHAALLAELAASMPGKDRQRAGSKLEALVKTLVDSAVAGEAHAQTLLVSALARIGDAQDDEPASRTPADREILDSYVAGELPAITAEHFPTITEPMLPGAPVVLSVDASMAAGRRSAFSVIQAWRVGLDRYYLIDQLRERCDYADLFRYVGRFRKKYNPVAILIERAANGHALISDLGGRKIGKLVVAIEPDGRSKSTRLRVHADTIIAKRIYLPADQPWRDAFVSEFVKFPDGKFADQVDATIQFLDRAEEFASLRSRPRGTVAVLNLNSPAAP